MTVGSALWEPVPEIDDGPRPHLNKAMVLHTAVSNADDLYWYWKSGDAGPGVGSHFYIAKDGTLYQYLSEFRKTGHAFAANEFAVGVETWDGGDPAHTPWNAAQIDAIVSLGKALLIPGKSLKETPSDGVGYHRQYPSWNLNGHTCPDDLRVTQVPGIISKLSAGGGHDDMGSGNDFFDQLVSDGVSKGDFSAAVQWWAGYQRGYRQLDNKHPTLTVYTAAWTKGTAEGKPVSP